MKFLTGTGGEKLPAGLDPKSIIVERSVPVAAMADALLAWEMNGTPISLAHGYRLSPPGSKGDPNQPSVQEMSVKSWINKPGTEAVSVKAGTVQIQGVAFGGLNAVAKVEVSLDGGKTWAAARFVGPDLGRFENAGGYNNTSWRDHAVQVVVS